MPVVDIKAYLELINIMSIIAFLILLLPLLKIILIIISITIQRFNSILRHNIFSSD